MIYINQENLTRKIISLAVPAVLRLGMQSIVSIMALIMVGHLGPQAIAAVGVGNRFLFIMIAVLMALSVGVTALVARYVGAGDDEQVQCTIQQALFLSFAGGLIIALAGWILAPVLIKGLLILQEDVDAKLVRLCTGYLRMALLPMTIGFLVFFNNAVFQGAGDMKTPLYIMIEVNLINLILIYLLVNGIGPFPVLGVKGAGLAQGLSRAIGGVTSLCLLIKGRGPVKLVFDRFHLNWNIIKKLLNIGLPASGENFVRQGSQLIYSVIIASWGTVTLAANQVAMSILSLSFMPGFGFALSATALVGQSLGAGDQRRAARIGYLATRLTLIFSLFIGSVFFFMGKTIASLYTTDPQVINLTAYCLKIIAVTQPALAVVQVLAGALRGAGDTKWVLYITTIGNWGVRLTLSIILGFYFNLHLVGVWLAMASDQIIRALLTFWRYRNENWIKVFLDQEKRFDDKH